MHRTLHFEQEIFWVLEGPHMLNKLLAFISQDVSFLVVFLYSGIIVIGYFTIILLGQSPTKDEQFIDFNKKGLNKCSCHESHSGHSDFWVSNQAPG